MMWPALVFAAWNGTVDLSDRSQATLRSGAGNQPVAYDLMTTAGALATLGDRLWLLRASYGVSATLLDLEQSFSPVALQTATFDITWKRRFVELSLNQTGSYGIENTAYLALQGTAPTMMQQAVQLVPTQNVNVQYISYAPSLQATLLPDLRWRIRLGVGYSLFGGVDEPSRNVIPFLKGPNAQADAYYAVTRRDSVFAVTDGFELASTETTCPLASTLLTAGENNSVACKPDTTIVEGRLGYSHNFSAKSSILALSAGAAGLRTREDPTKQYDNRVFPTAEVEYSYGLNIEGHKTEARANLHLAPFIDYRTGLADYRAMLTANVLWHAGRLTLTEFVAGSVTVETIDLAPSDLFIVTSGAEYHVTKLFAVDAAVNYVWEQQTGLPTASSVLLSVGVTLHAPLLRF